MNDIVTGPERNNKAFLYLKEANNLLNDTSTVNEGRDMIVRALDRRSEFENFDNILKQLVRKSGLLPYLKSEFESLDYGDKIAIEFFKPINQDEYVFHSMQYKIYDLLIKGKNIILSAPTSMGKSAIVDALIYSGKFNKILIIVPTIALIDETRKRIQKKFSSDYEVIHHSIQVATKEKIIYILTQERFNEREDVKDLDLFVIDEFYKLSFKKDTEDERVIALNVALSRLLKISKQFYMIGPSIDEVRGIGTITPEYYFISTNFSTVAVNVHEYNISANDKDNKNKTLIEILKKYKGQTIIYCRSSVSAKRIVNELISAGIGNTAENPYSKWIKDEYLPEWDYSIAISNSIGIHHGNLPRAIQQKTIDLFNNGFLNIIICTSTIIEGVNTTAENVIIYDNRNGSMSIDKFTHNNIKGRAGRMRSHFVGNVFCLESVPAENISSQTVEVPIGIQNSGSSLNLLLGMQAEHLSEESTKRLTDFINGNIVPLDILRKHVTYSYEKILTLYNAIMTLREDYFRELIFNRIPSSKGMLLICRALISVESASLRSCSIRDDEEALKGRLSSYIMSGSFTEYLKRQLLWVNENYDEVSDGVSNELKIVRVLYKYTIPKFLSLLWDIVEYRCLGTNNLSPAGYSYLISIFENMHLHPNLSIFEEMGVPIQILDKISSHYDADLSFEEIYSSIKNNRIPKVLTEFERDFLIKALE